MTPEVPLQHNMFTGELDDTRTRRQKQLDRKQVQPYQHAMFSQREIAQFGVRAHPLIPLSPQTKLVLVREDPRTDEEIEADRERAAREQTEPMFGEERGLEVEQGEKPRASRLLDPETRANLPALYSGEERGFDALAQVKFFTPDAGWIWYVSEGSPMDEDGDYDTHKPEVDFIFFGLVVGFEVELDYFALSQLESVRGQLGMSIERDLDFEPKTLRELVELHESGLDG